MPLFDDVDVKEFIANNKADGYMFTDRVKESMKVAEAAAASGEPNILNTIIQSPDFILLMSHMGVESIPTSTMIEPQGVLMYTLVMVAATVEKLKS